MKTQFVDAFTIMGWVTLFLFITYCTAKNIDTDSVRDAWNLMFVIGGYVWGRSQAKKTSTPGTASVDISATTTTTTE